MAGAGGVVRTRAPTAASLAALERARKMVDDLAAVVQAGFDPDAMRALFAPGLVADVHR